MSAWQDPEQDGPKFDIHTEIIFYSKQKSCRGSIFEENRLSREE
jgi:hypothetical protein